MNNNDEHIVKPELVDMSKVQVTNTDNLLSRERDNIVNASIQANQAINKEQATQVNNQIQIDNKLNKKKVTVLIISIALLIIGAIVCFILFSKVFNDTGEVKKTTTTQKIDNETVFTKNYNNGNIVRKYEGSEYVLILTPDSFGKYLLLNKNSSFYTGGKFSKDDKHLYLTEEITGVVNTAEVEKENLLFFDVNMTYNDSEYKYYEGNNTYLLINASIGKEKAMYYSNNEYSICDFTETNNTISLSNGVIFNKVGDKLDINGTSLNMVS